MLDRIPLPAKILTILVGWAALAIYLQLIHFEPYGIEEPAAQALLLIWSVVDRVANPIVLGGLPDFRSLLFIPLGIYWTGSLMAVKIFTLLVVFSAGLLLYRWSRLHYGEETALIGTGLLLVAPLSFMQINSVGSGPYLLLLFAVAGWLDQRYRQVQRHLGGWYFLQLILAAIAVSLHPAGLAYPLALLWEWHKHPVDSRHQKHVFIGIGIIVIITLLMRMGWRDLAWLLNPLPTLAQLLYFIAPNDLDSHGFLATVALILVAVALLSNFRMLWQDLVGRMLVLGLVLGLVSADSGWAMLALCIVLYPGVYTLIQANQASRWMNFWGQRGLVITLVFFTLTLFMMGDKAQRRANLVGVRSAEDEIMLTLAQELEGRDQPAITISQWPARTLLATKQPAFPLPPEFADAETLLKNIHQAHADYLLFNPSTHTNKTLARQVSELSTNIKTVAVLPNNAALFQVIHPEKAP